MCDCSQTADELSPLTAIETWMHATASTAATVDSATPSMGKYAPKKTTSGGKYIVLINGSTDAAYVIQNAQWSSSTAGDAVPGDRSTSIAVEGSITVSEPKGIAFLDQIVKCSIALGVDSSQVVYSLKTFFVGHVLSDNGTESIDTISDIPPVTFITYDVTGNFTEAGGTYEMSFVGAGHGAVRLPQYSKAVNSLTLSSGPTLEDTMTKLANNINESYDKYFSCVYEQIKQLNGIDSERVLKALRKVKYTIEVGEPYKAANGGAKYTITDQPQQYKDAAGCTETVQINFPAHTSIETAISTIMSMSLEVRNDMNIGDSKGVKYEYKVHTSLKSTLGTGDDVGLINYEVYYRIDRFATPKTLANNPVFEVLQQDKPEDNPAYAAIRNNILTFDYMYTGRNIDILEFDMRLNTGLAYLQTATIVNAFKSQLDRAPSTHIQPSVQDLSNSRWGSANVLQIPVLFGSQLKVPGITSTNDSSGLAQSMYTLNKHASIEMAEAAMKIVGNDQLLGSTNRTTSPSYVTGSSNATASAPDAPSTGDFQYWSHAPAYVKVNIKMPRSNDDLAAFTGTNDDGTQTGLDYAVDFWFDGYYYVYGIQHSFVDGEFTQTLQMLGIPKRSTFDVVNDKKRVDVDITTLATECFDNQVQCKGGATPTQNSPNKPTVPFHPTGDATTSTTPTNRQDARTTFAQAKSLDEVKGWTSPDDAGRLASPAVKAAILDAAAKYQMNPITLAQIASFESHFNPTIKNPLPRATATGLFQFIDGTWMGLVTQGKILGIASNTPPATALPLRTNPTYNAYAGAAFIKENAQQIGSSDVGDLYLSHLMGYPRAKSIIKADNASGGSATLSSVLGASVYAEVKSQNPAIFSPKPGVTITTVGELRTQTAIVMARQLLSPIAVARAQSAPPAQAVKQPTQTAPTAEPAPTPTANVAVSNTYDCAAATKKDVQNCNKSVPPKDNTPTAPVKAAPKKTGDAFNDAPYP